jgi:hypothetical protein
MKRFWTATLLVAAVCVGIWMAGVRYSTAVSLKDQHSEPAKVMPAQPVAVAADGKLYIHGKPVMMSAREAAEKGYTPDPRCMKKALGRK